MRAVTIIFVVAFACSAATPSLARSSKEPQHSDLTILKKSDKSSPKLMSAKPVKQNSKRFDPYKNYKFR